MKKIPGLFKRNHETHKIYDVVTEGCEWVIKGEGTPTRKFDGTACMIKNGKLYKRYDCKKGRKLPEYGLACQPNEDPETGHWPWWVPVTDNDKYHKEALKGMPVVEMSGTYELCGPKVNGNPEGFENHTLIKHGSVAFTSCPTDFVALPQWLTYAGVEGIVWHHSDGRMCKIKLKDFGIKREKR